MESDTSQKKFLAKTHSVFFPLHWKEALVSPESLLMASGVVKSTEDLERFEELLRERD